MSANTNVRAFDLRGPSITVAATAVSQRVALRPGNNLRVYNSGAVVIFVEAGDVTVVAAVATSLPIAPGDTRIVKPAPEATHVAVITLSSTATVYVTNGQGT